MCVCVIVPIIGQENVAGLRLPPLFLMNTIDLYKQLDVLVVSAYVSQQRNHLNALLDIAEMKRSSI